MLATIYNTCSTVYSSIEIPKRFIQIFSDVGQVAVPASAAAYSAYTGDYEGIGWLSIAVVVNQICVEVLKRLTQQKRPNKGKHSFPSGHTAAAFLGPVFFVRRYGFRNVPIPFLCASIFAMLVGAGRVAVNAHWTRDVIGGALLACVVGYASLPPLS
jgi:membrane-associated phospholipid phosphatase